MVAADDIFEIASDVCRNGDVVSRLGVFRDQDVALPEPEAPDLLRRRSRLHESRRVIDLARVVDVSVIAEANRLLIRGGVLVDVAGA